MAPAPEFNKGQRHASATIGVVETSSAACQAYTRHSTQGPAEVSATASRKVQNNPLQPNKVKNRLVGTVVAGAFRMRNLCWPGPHISSCSSWRPSSPYRIPGCEQVQSSYVLRGKIAKLNSKTILGGVTQILLDRAKDSNSVQNSFTVMRNHDCDRADPP